MLPVVWSDQHWLHVLRHLLLDLLVKSLTEHAHERGGARNNDIAIKRLPEVDIALLDAARDHLMDARVLKPDQRRVEQDLGSFRSLCAKLEGRTVRQTVVALVHLMSLILAPEVVEILLGLEGLDVASVLFDVTNNLELSSCVERVACPPQELHQVRSHIPAAKVHPLS